ncbi:MAG TPA: zinc ribbon domain-containing protein [Pyrinomonadaceae bacterium]|nr:zinc ribbon domain-containing protein [Pyrinomonadaceae bacterium]
MFCPQCGQQQVPGVVRFCSRCGFPLDGVMQLLGNGGMLPVYHSPAEPGQISPRRKGVKQGAVLILSGAVIVPILGVLASFSNAAFPQILAAMAAIICFIGGPFRMLYAALFEEGAPPRHFPNYGPPPAAAPQQFGSPRQHTALPPPPARSTSTWRRPNTAELANPPSVTENTTRLLDKEDRK